MKPIVDEQEEGQGEKARKDGAESSIRCCQPFKPPPSPTRSDAKDAESKPRVRRSVESGLLHDELGADISAGADRWECSEDGIVRGEYKSRSISTSQGT